MARSHLSRQCSSMSRRVFVILLHVYLGKISSFGGDSFWTGGLLSRHLAVIDNNPCNVETHPTVPLVDLIPKSWPPQYWDHDFNPSKRNSGCRTSLGHSAPVLGPRWDLRSTAINKLSQALRTRTPTPPPPQKKKKEQRKTRKHEEKKERERYIYIYNANLPTLRVAR